MMKEACSSSRQFCWCRAIFFIHSNSTTVHCHMNRWKRGGKTAQKSRYYRYVRTYVLVKHTWGSVFKNPRLTVEQNIVVFSNIHVRVMSKYREISVVTIRIGPWFSRSFPLVWSCKRTRAHRSYELTRTLLSSAEHNTQSTSVPINIIFYWRSNIK